jgi:hypothetical protein
LNLETPHYLRFARVLALTTGLAATSCGTSVTPDDARDDVGGSVRRDVGAGLYAGGIRI